MDLKVGDKFRIREVLGSNKKKIDRVVHIRGIVDDWVVFRWCEKGKWQYTMEHMCLFDHLLENNNLYVV